MITDAKPLLWATAPVLVLVACVAGVVSVVDPRISIAMYGAFLAGAALLWVNLALGAALVESVTSVLARGGNPSLGAAALMVKTGFLFVCFLGLGQLLGMLPVVLGAMATVGSFGVAIVTVPILAPTVMETA